MLHSVILNAVKNPVVVVFALLCAGMAFAAPKSASAYYSDAAFQYIENRLPTAEITCNEGLQYYPNDQKLQMLLDRIKEAKDEQKNENKKNDPKNDQNNDQNQDQNQDKDSQDQNKDNQEQNKDQNQDQNQDQNSGESSSSQGDNQSSDSNGGADQQPQPDQPEDQSSDSQGEDQQQPEETPAVMSPEDAAQMLKDFDEQNGERKPWKPIRGQARPARDW